MSNIRTVVLTHLAAVMQEHSPLPVPDPFRDEMAVEDFWLDSLAYTSLFTVIEADLGFIPPDILNGETFPATVGELIAMYESAAEAAS
jgi:acyl carrier protein